MTDDSAAERRSDIRSKVLHGLKWTAFVRFSAQIISWAMTIVVIRFLTPDDYGLKAMAEVMFSFLLLLSSAGIGSAVIQASELSKRQLQQIFAVLLVVNGVLCVLQFVTASFVAAYYNDPRVTLLLRVLALGFLIVPFRTMPFALLARRMEFKRRSLVELFGAVSAGLLTLALALMGFGVWSLIWGQLAGLLIPTIGFHMVAPWLHWPVFSVRGAGQLIRFGTILTGGDLVYFLYSRADMLIAGPLLGAKLLGYYAVASDLASLPRVKLMPLLHQVAFPAYARMKDQPDHVARYFLKATRYCSLIIFPFFFGMAGVAEPFVVLVLGEEWRASVLPLVLLCLLMPLRAMNTLFAPMVNALGRPEVQFVNGLFTLAVMAVGFFVGVRYGVIGLCYAWIVAFPIAFLFCANRSLAVVNLSLLLFLQTLLPATILGASMFGCLLLMAAFLDTLNWLSFMAMVFMGALIYIGMLFVLFREYFVELLAFIRR